MKYYVLERRGGRSDRGWFGVVVDKLILFYDGFFCYKDVEFDL